MSLILSKSPAGTNEVVAGAVRRAHQAKFSLRSAMGGGSSTVVTPVSPLRVYLLNLKQITDGTGLGAAKAVGWQSLILQGKNAVAAVDFNSDANGQASVFKSYNQGAQVQSIASAITVAETLSEVVAANYEPRLLQMPAINLMALWLHGTKDIVIPLDPAPGIFKPYVTYEPKPFFDLAVKLAVRRLAFDDRPKRAETAKPDPGPEIKPEKPQDHLNDDDQGNEPPLQAAG